MYQMQIPPYCLLEHSIHLSALLKIPLMRYTRRLAPFALRSTRPSPRLLHLPPRGDRSWIIRKGARVVPIFVNRLPMIRRWPETESRVSPIRRNFRLSLIYDLYKHSRSRACSLAEQNMCADNIYPDYVYPDRRIRRDEERPHHAPRFREASTFSSPTTARERGGGGTPRRTRVPFR